MRLVATGTGFAHPNSSPPMASRMPGTSTVPTGSIWRSGFRLKRPSISAVRSPKYRAIQPCATSCRVIAKSTGIVHRSKLCEENQINPMLALVIYRKTRALVARIARHYTGTAAAKGVTSPRPTRTTSALLARQIDHRGRHQTAVAAVEHQIDAVLELLVDLAGIGARQHPRPAAAGRAHHRLAELGQQHLR